MRPIVERSWTLATRAPHLTPPPRGRGVAVMSLQDAILRHPERIEPLLGAIAGPETGAFTSLNTAFFEDGVFIEIEKGAVITEPIDLVFDAAAAEIPEVAYPRVLVAAGEGSQATIVESWTGRGGRPYFSNAVTEIAVGDGAVIQHFKVQREDTAAFHVQQIAARVGRSARLTSHNIALGGALARTDLDVLLAEEGAECELNGLYLASGSQHIDNHTVIDHAKPHGTSRELYKGVLDGRSRGVFHGIDHRSARRAEDRRDADQQEPAAFERGAGRLDARASRSSPTTSSASTARRSARSTRPRSSTCAPAASAKRRPAP